MSAQGRQWTIFFVYTLWSVLAVIAMVPLALMLIAPLRLDVAVRENPLPSALIAVQTAAAAWSVRAALRSWTRGTGRIRHGRWDLPQVGVLRGHPWTLAVVALPSVLLAGLTVADATPPWLLLISVGVLTVAALIRLPWQWGLLAAVGLGLLFGPLGLTPRLGAPYGAILVAAISTIRSSLWLAAVVRELDDARTAQSQLAVAEERMRFARDLHDVTGRDLSAIAVKSELVAQLVERADRRALEHSREVAQIARTSLAEIRALVRGYREVDLEAELQGTISLLRSAQVEVTVEGTAGSIPARHDQLAAWVLREGGTNTLRHSDPQRVTITLEATGIRLVNDGAPTGTAVREGSGLQGLRERLGQDAALEARLEGGAFTLEAAFTDAPPRTEGAAPAAAPDPSPLEERP